MGPVRSRKSGPSFHVNKHYYNLKHTVHEKSKNHLTKKGKFLGSCNGNKNTKSKCSRKQNLALCRSEESPFLVIITKFRLVFILQEGVTSPSCDLSFYRRLKRLKYMAQVLRTSSFWKTQAIIMVNQRFGGQILDLWPRCIHLAAPREQWLGEQQRGFRTECCLNCPASGKRPSPPSLQSRQFSCSLSLSFSLSVYKDKCALLFHFQCQRQVNPLPSLFPIAILFWKEHKQRRLDFSLLIIGKENFQYLYRTSLIAFTEFTGYFSPRK